MGKLVGVVKHVDVRGCIVCTMYVVYVSVGNCKQSVSMQTSYGKVCRSGETC